MDWTVGSSGRKAHTNSPRSSPESDIARVALALVMAEVILRRFLMMDSSDISLSTSSSVKDATASGSNPAKARRRASLRRRMVSHDRPDWKLSRAMRSYTPGVSRTGNPHSLS